MCSPEIFFLRISEKSVPYYMYHALFRFFSKKPESKKNKKNRSVDC